jgi:hypothetical protein
MWGSGKVYYIISGIKLVTLLLHTMAPSLRFSVSLPNISLCEYSYLVPSVDADISLNNVGAPEGDETGSLSSDISDTVVSEAVEVGYGDSDFGDSFSEVPETEDENSDFDDSHMFVEATHLDSDSDSGMEPGIERALLHLDLELANEVSSFCYDPDSFLIHPY